jgi:hypothetical protein
MAVVAILVSAFSWGWNKAIPTHEKTDTRILVMGPGVKPG